MEGSYLAIKKLSNRLDFKRDEVNVISTGFRDLDALILGWERGKFVVIGARPAMGKTAFALSMLHHIAVERNIPVALFSLEMSLLQLLTRFVSQQTSLTTDKLRTDILDDQERKIFNTYIDKLENAPIYVDDTQHLSVDNICKKAEKLFIEHDIRLIVIDYLQLIENKKQTEVVISQQLKELARKLNIPIVALAQVSRRLEYPTKHKRPQLCDFKDITIEENADVILLLYRPEYYNISEWDEQGHLPTAGMAEFVLSKHYNQNTLRSIYLRWEAGKFSDLEKNYSQTKMVCGKLV